MTIPLLKWVPMATVNTSDDPNRINGPCGLPYYDAFRKFEYIKGLAYKKQTDYLLKYVEWKHRANTLEYRGMPNYKFVKILHNKCKKLHKKKC